MLPGLGYAMRMRKRAEIGDTAGRPSRNLKVRHQDEVYHDGNATRTDDCLHTRSSSQSGDQMDPGRAAPS